MLYTRRGSDASFVVRGILDESAATDDQMQGSYGEKIVTGLVTLHLADGDILNPDESILYRGVEKPLQGDKVSYKGREYEVQNFSPDGMGLNVLELNR